MSASYKIVGKTSVSITDNSITKYGKLQFILFFVHYACSLAIVGIDSRFPNKSFEIEYNFQYNLWGTNDGDNTCESGCTLSAETYTFPDKINVNILVSFFSFVSGTNHFIQFIILKFYPTSFQSWLDNGYFFIRSIDFGVSAGLMLLANSILFYAPPDVQTLVLFFLFQCLTQLGGYSSEVLLSNDKTISAKHVFWVSGVLYLIPWSLRFAMFFLTVKKNALGDNVESNTPPIQVWFFLAWIFQTFMLFPLSHWFKLREENIDSDTCLKYEIIYSLLSFLAKLPLLSVFIGGSFQRDAFTRLETENFTTSTESPTSGFDGNTYLALFLPMGLSILGSIFIVYSFWSELGLQDLDTKWKNFYQIGNIAGKCALYLIATTFVAFIPILIGFANDDPTTVIFMSLVLTPALASVAWGIDILKS